MNQTRIPRDFAPVEHPCVGEPDQAASFRLGLLTAVIVHAGVFAVTWPNLVADEAPTPDKVTVLPFEIVTFVPPPPTARHHTLPPRRVPVPDPSPFDPEPIRAVPPIVDARPVHTDLVPVVPDPPPMPDEVGTPSVVDAGILVEPPRVLHRVEPRSTDAAIRIRYECAVVLSLLIDTDGRVADVTVLQEQPFGLTESAVSAARQWRFEPCTFDGRPVSVRYTLTVRFNLAR